MKQLLLSAIILRLRLIRTNKSHIKGEQVEQFMVNLRYWIESGADLQHIVERWDKQIRTILTSNFINKYEQLKQGK